MQEVREIPMRIKAAMLKPQAINGLFGLEICARFLHNYNLSDQSLTREAYQRKVEDDKPVLYCADNWANPSMAAMSGDLNTEARTIAQINLKGVMLAEGDICTYGIDRTCRQIRAAAANPNIMAIILNTSSGGGEVEAAQRLSNELTESIIHKPIIQYVDGGMAASGAYWAGAHCTEIVAGGRTAAVGSIGVVIQMDAEMIEYLNENLISIFSEGSDRKQDVFRAILSGDYEFVKKEALNPIRSEFIRVVKKGRGEVDEDAFDGRMFSASKAKKANLIDFIGTRQVALKRAEILAKRQSRKTGAARAIAALTYAQ